MKIECVLFDLGNTLVPYFTTDEFRPILRQGIACCCRDLARRGYKYDEPEIFARALDVTGERKPNSTIFKAALDRLQVAPQATLLSAMMSRWISRGQAIPALHRCYWTRGTGPGNPRDMSSTASPSCRQRSSC